MDMRRSSLALLFVALASACGDARSTAASASATPVVVSAPSRPEAVTAEVASAHPPAPSASASSAPARDPLDVAFERYDAKAFPELDHCDDVRAVLDVGLQVEDKALAKRVLDVLAKHAEL